MEKYKTTKYSNPKIYKYRKYRNTFWSWGKVFFREMLSQGVASVCWPSSGILYVCILYFYVFLPLFFLSIYAISIFWNVVTGSGQCMLAIQWSANSADCSVSPFSIALGGPRYFSPQCIFLSFCISIFLYFVVLCFSILPLESQDTFPHSDNDEVCISVFLYLHFLYFCIYIYRLLCSFPIDWQVVMESVIRTDLLADTFPTSLKPHF